MTIEKQLLKAIDRIDRVLEFRAALGADELNDLGEARARVVAVYKRFRAARKASFRSASVAVAGSSE